MAKKITVKNLVRLNTYAAVLHFFQAVAVFFLSKDFSLPISGSFLKYNETAQQLEPASKVLFNLSLPTLIVIFFLLSGIAHLMVATVYKKKYARNLSIGLNRARWFEYSLSASVMIVAIGLLVGVYDINSLLMMFVLTAVMNLMGLTMEVHNQTTSSTNWLSFNIGTLAGIVPWVAIASYMWLGASDGSKAPAFVYWIFVSIFAFFSCFAVNMVLQYRKIGPWRDYLYGERMYIILSLVAKSLLAWQVFAGTLRP